PRIKVLIVGNGELETKLKESVKSDTRFIFLDFQNQTLMPLIYRLGDVFILPSLGPGETWGLALNEAMASGLPVIASSRCGGAPDLIINEEVGLIFKPEEVEKVKNFIQQLFKNPDFKEKAAQAAVKQIKNFNFATV